MGWEWPEVTEVKSLTEPKSLMYKDKDKQREAGKERQRRYRDKHKPTIEVTPLGSIRVSKPGDDDYVPMSVFKRKA